MTQLKTGDRVQVRTSGSTGVISEIPRQRELWDCGLVLFDGQREPLLMTKKSLEKVG